MDPNQGGINAVLGFEYQLLYGLYLLMKSDENVSEYVENYDDLTIESTDGTTELIQTKYTGTPKTINDSSLEFWNSLRNWSYNIKRSNVNLEKSNFVLITMNKVDEDSILHCLKPENSNYRTAYEKIHELGVHTKNKQIKNKYYPEFKSLKPETQFELLKKISVLDNAPTIKNIKQKIMTIISGFTDEEFVQDYYTDLYGWWRNTLLEKLDPNNNEPISWSELSKIRIDLRNKYRKQILFQSVTIDEIQNSVLPNDDSTFIKQLSLIDVTNEKSILNAKLDFEMAKRQNDAWVEENESYDEEIQKFKNKVRRDYSNKFDLEKNTITSSSNKLKKINWGLNMYRWGMFDTDWKISDTSEDSYKRGTLHDLADVPSIGWHPFYKEELKK